MTMPAMAPLGKPPPDEWVMVGELEEFGEVGLVPEAGGGWLFAASMEKAGRGTM